MVQAEAVKQLVHLAIVSGKPAEAGAEMEQVAFRMVSVQIGISMLLIIQPVHQILLSLLQTQL